jgi:hypothetical protein
MSAYLLGIIARRLNHIVRKLNERPLSCKRSATRMETCGRKLLTKNPELTAVEHLTPIGHPETGVLRPVDMGWLETVLDRYAEAVSAVTRGNIRAGGNRKIDRCVRAIFETGKPAPGCLTDSR